MYCMTHSSSCIQDVLMLGAVGAYGWSGTVVHQTGTKANIFPKKSFEKILEDRNHSSLLGNYIRSLNVSALLSQLNVYGMNLIQMSELVHTIPGSNVYMLAV